MNPVRNNNYIPRLAKIERVFLETPEIKTFYLKYPLDFTPTPIGISLGYNQLVWGFTPGQFLEVSCFGIGEAPISICSSPKEELLSFSFKRIGSVTAGLFNLKEKDTLGIRGPFGRGFPLEYGKKRELIFIAGGIGIAPLRSLLKFVLSQRQDKIKNVILLYGARTPQEMLYKKELEDWKRFIKVLLTVDKPDEKWKGNVGVVLELLNEIQIDTSNSLVFICGPEIMLRFTVARLIALGMEPSDIILSLERYMKCGMGKCGHCYIADKFVCRDGPVFSYEALSNLIPEEIL